MAGGDAAGRRVLQELRRRSEFPKPDRGGGYGAVWVGMRAGTRRPARRGCHRETRALCARRTCRPGTLRRGERGSSWDACTCPTAIPSRPEFDYKLTWMKRVTLMRRACSRRSAGRSGRGLQCRPDPDFVDIYNTRSCWTMRCSSRARAAYAALLEQAGRRARQLHPDERIYTSGLFSERLTRATTRLTIDHFLLTPPPCHSLYGGGVDARSGVREGAANSRAGLYRVGVPDSVTGAAGISGREDTGHDRPETPACAGV
jgi:hypothetical protein